MGAISITNNNENAYNVSNFQDIINAALTFTVDAAINTAITKIDHKQLEWYHNYTNMIENITRIKTNFVDPFADQSYNYIYNALPEFERLENDRDNDPTDGNLTTLLQEIASAAYLGRTLNNQIILINKRYIECKSDKKELLDKIKELEAALLVHSGEPGYESHVQSNIEWSTGKIAGGVPILFIIGRFNIMLAWYNYYYFNMYNPTATIEPQKYLFIKQMVETYGTSFDPALGMSPALAELKRLEQESFND